MSTVVPMKLQLQAPLLPPADIKADDGTRTVGGARKCHHSGCKYAERGFQRERDLKRHLESVHGNYAKKRGCPYPGSGCKIMADEKHQLTNWYDHLVTIHQSYTYPCSSCNATFPHRKGTDTHHKTTGHRCMPSQWDDTQREKQLAEKNRCYQIARGELQVKKREGTANAWNDAWPETLPEYANFLRKKADRPQSSRPSSTTASSLPNASDLSVPSTIQYQSSSVISGKTRSKTRRFHPYPRPEESGISSEDASDMSQQGTIEDSLAKCSGLQFSLPWASAGIDWADSSHIGHGTTAPMSPEGFSFLPSTSLLGAYCHDTSLPVPMLPLPPALSSEDPKIHSPNFLTQEEVDYICELSVFDASQSGIPTESWEVGRFVPGELPALLSPASAEPVTPSSWQGTCATFDSPYSDLVLTPPYLQLAQGPSTPNSMHCLDGSGTVSPHLLHFNH